jgi:LmbE family N-acetylglucosaminyl deacetylase
MRVLFVSPHPDDVEFFAGGALLHHVGRGDDVTVLMLSHGEDGTRHRARKGRAIATVRTREAMARYAELPSVRLLWLDWVDGAIRYSPEGVNTIAAAIAEAAPDWVYAPEASAGASLFHHPDHLAAGRMAAEASDGRLLRHYHTARPNAYVPIDEAAHAANRRALRHYRSQFGPDASPPFLLTWGEPIRELALRWWGQSAGVKRAEAFRHVPAAIRPEP